MDPLEPLLIYFCGIDIVTEREWQGPHMFLTRVVEFTTCVLSFIRALKLELDGLLGRVVISTLSPFNALQGDWALDILE